MANDKDNPSPQNRKKRDMFPLPKSKKLLYSDNKQAKCDFTSAVYVKYHVSFLHFTNKIWWGHSLRGLDSSSLI